MALKPDRHEFKTNIRYFMNEVAERGGIATVSTSASGAALDVSVHLATYTGTSISGAIPAGILLNDMVNIDQTRQHLNQHKDEVQQGNKVTLLEMGDVTTNWIRPDADIIAGHAAYVGPSGYITNIQDTGAVQIGKFETERDIDGYAIVKINIPAASRADVAFDTGL